MSSSASSRAPASRAAHNPPASHGNPGSPGARQPGLPATGQAVAPAAVVVVDVDERILHLSGPAFAAHALQTGDWTGRRLVELLPTEAQEALVPRYRAALAGEPQFFDYHSHDGLRSYRVQITPVSRDGAVSSVVAVMQDITEREHMTLELARSEARLRETERLVGVGSWELDLASDIITYSPGFARLLGVDPDSRLDLRGHLEHVHPADRGVVSRAGAECLRTGTSTCEYRIVRPDGEHRTLSLRAECPPDARAGRGRRYMRGAVLDVTRQREAERQGVAAEHLFREGFDAAPIGMALSDLDLRYTRVNDAMCGLTGRSRKELLGAGVQSISHPDDEPGLRRSQALMRSGAISHFQGEKRYVRPDGGVVWVMVHVAPVRGEDGDIKAFHSQIVDVTEARERELRLEQDVADALWLGRIRDAIDEQRLVLYAQPIVDLTTGETVQQELLLRMRERDGTIIGPGEFLPVAERYGLISEIDRWVICQAVAIAAQGTPAEFNLSGRSIGDPAVLRELATALQETGADPSLLVVEVTETAFADHTDSGRRFAQSVRELGCRLALDDFGTGFSSLSYLKHLTADHLKIDIDFVRELTTNQTDVRVVRGIVGLAREFDQITVAEGVEDADTLLLLKELGVDLAQGYLFGRPAPREAPGAQPEAGRRPHGAGCPDPVQTVREAFACFAARDLPGMLGYCHSDFVLRPLTTSRLAARSEPYRGHEGLRTYMRDVATVWDELTLTPLMFRGAQDSVIGFGRADGRRGEERVLHSIMWVVRLDGGKIASVEVFQAADDGTLSPSQLQRLARRDT